MDCLGEPCFPPARRGFGDALGRMGLDPLQHIDPVGVGIDALQAAGGDQALDDADAFGPDFGPAEQPVATAHGNRPQGACEVVRIQRYIGKRPPTSSTVLPRWVI